MRPLPAGGTWHYCGSFNFWPTLMFSDTMLFSIMIAAGVSPYWRAIEASVSPDFTVTLAGRGVGALAVLAEAADLPAAATAGVALAAVPLTGLPLAASGVAVFAEASVAAGLESVERPLVASVVAVATSFLVALLVDAGVAL